MSTRPKSSNCPVKRVTTSVVAKNLLPRSARSIISISEHVAHRTAQRHSLQLAGAALQAASSRSGNENVASSVVQTSLEATTPVANSVRNLEGLILRIGLASDQVLAHLATIKETLQSKTELPRTFVYDANTPQGDFNGLLELEFAILRSLTWIEQAIAFGREEETSNETEESSSVVVKPIVKASLPNVGDGNPEIHFGDQDKSAVDGHTQTINQDREESRAVRSNSK